MVAHQPRRHQDDASTGDRKFDKRIALIAFKTAIRRHLDNLALPRKAPSVRVPEATEDEAIVISQIPWMFGLAVPREIERGGR